MRIIERWTDQIVHCRVDNHESPVFAALHVDDAGDENARIADDEAARFEDETTAQMTGSSADDVGVAVGVVGIRVFAGAIGDAEAAAEIDVIDRMAVRAQIGDEFREQKERILEWREIGDLRADVHIDAGDVNAGQRGGVRVDLAGACDRDAELVFRLAG